MRRRKPDPAAAAAPEDQQAARLAALKLLNRRDYGARELGERLAERGFAAATAQTIVDRLVQEKLLDDSRFAEHFVAYHANRGQGPVRIAHKLREAGVAAELISASVDAGSADWRRRCAEVRRKRFGAREPGSWAERGKQARFLTQRGFSSDQVRAAIGRDLDGE
ncbi:MAG: regulatory protein RecX [Steroidobacteraceae bacterium]|nr:regulatory protein RecX [Steroidobacteraceae bacterium]